MKHIWIVDDDEEMTEALRMMLGLIDCHTSGFLDARSTVHALLAGGQVDLILLDINLPDVSGLDLLEYVRRRSDWDTLPIVMISSEAADVTIDKAIALGADGYITKPVTIEEIERVFDEAFQKREKGNLH